MCPATDCSPVSCDAQQLVPKSSQVPAAGPLAHLGPGIEFLRLSCIGLHVPLIWSPDVGKPPYVLEFAVQSKCSITGFLNSFFNSSFMFIPFLNCTKNLKRFQTIRQCIGVQRPLQFSGPWMPLRCQRSFPLDQRLDLL